jgi:hypothetical protein
MRLGEFYTNQIDAKLKKAKYKDMAKETKDSE